MAAPLTDIGFTSLSPEEVLALANPPPEYKEVRWRFMSKHPHSLIAVQLLQKFVPPPIDYDDQTKALATLRNFMSMAEKADKTDPKVDEETLYAPARDGFQIPLKVWRPSARAINANSQQPLIVLYFGGGNVVGVPTILASIARPLVKRRNAVVVAPAYRLAPENPFPASVNDSWDAFAWIAEHATTELKAAPSLGFVVGGVSSGGTHSLVIAHLARDRGVQPKITGLCLSCIGARLPGPDLQRLPEVYRERYLSRQQHACIDSPTTSSGMAKLIQDSCRNDYSSELFAPLLWPTEAGHKNLPKSYFQICGAEVSRDEVLILQDIMKKEDVPTKLHLYVGLPHTFWGLLKDLPQSKKWLDDTMEGFDWLMQRTE